MPLPSTDAAASEETRAFPFRPWVRRTCTKAMLWGMGVLTLLVAGALWLEGPGVAVWGTALRVLAAYGLLFWASLLKVWWTAGGSAVEVGPETLSYQPLHTFRPKRIPYSAILACSPRPGTQSLRLVVAGSRGDRELFLNLGVVDGRHAFLDLLGERLEAHGLEPVPSARNAWARPAVFQ